MTTEYQRGLLRGAEMCESIRAKLLADARTAVNEVAACALFAAARALRAEAGAARHSDDTKRCKQCGCAIIPSGCVNGCPPPVEGAATATEQAGAMGHKFPEEFARKVGTLLATTQDRGVCDCPFPRSKCPDCGRMCMACYSAMMEGTAQPANDKGRAR